MRRKLALSALATIAGVALFVWTTTISDWVSARLEAQTGPTGGASVLTVP